MPESKLAVRFRILVERPSSHEAFEALETKEVAESFSAAFKLGVGVFANPSYSSMRPTVGAGSDVFDRQFVIPLPNGQTSPHTTPSGVLSDTVWLRQDHLLTAITQCEIPEHWPPGGLLDVFVLAVLEPAQKFLGVAVDAGFSKPFSCEEEVEEETNADCRSPRDAAQVGSVPWDAQKEKDTHTD